MKKHAFFLSIITVITVLFSISCSDNSNMETATPVSPGLSGNANEIEITPSLRETETESESKLAKTMDEVNWDDYSLVMRDNERYFYFFNKSNNIYSGKVYYKASGYKYRGECKMINRGTAAIALWYFDSRYDNNKITTITAPGTGGGKLYYQPQNCVWNVSLSIQKGSL